MAISRFLPNIKQAVGSFDPQRKNRYFVFGSAARSEKFHDIDLGVQGNRNAKKPLGILNDLLYNSPIPYKVDIVDIDNADNDFRDYVLGDKAKIWIY